MTVSELIQLLSKYNNKDIEVNLKLIPNDGTEDDDDLNDIDIKCIGEIYTGGLDSDTPFVEIGFQETQYKKVIVVNKFGLSNEVISMIENPMYYVGEYKESGDIFADLRNSKNEAVRIFHERLKDY